MSGGPFLVRIGTGLAVLGTLHTAVNAALLRRPETETDPGLPQPTVSILVPARDEAPRIAACLRSLLSQDGHPAPEIIVVDDGSRDGTADVARAVAGTETRVRIMAGRPLPPGWLGKPHACHQLAEAAGVSDVLVFVDADVQLAPHAVRAAVGLLDRHALDFVSPYPRQVAGSVAERIIQPLLQWSWLTFLPLRLAEHARRPSLAVANGQFLVVRRAAYERAGGHAAVRAAIVDDVALARELRMHGARGGLVDGTHLGACRMYDGWVDLRDGYAKSLWAAFGSEPGAIAVVVLLVVMYLVPAIAMVRGSVVGTVGYLAGVAGRMLAAARCGARVWPDPFAHPVSVAVVAGLTARSLAGRRRGALAWKGRPLEVGR